MSDPSDSGDSASIPDVAVDGVDAIKQKLQACLDEIEAAGDFATFHRHPAFVNPGLTIQGDRRITLPLSQGDAKAIKTACRRAPFGQGDRTIVDTSVRNTWELHPSAFQLANPAWESYFTTILRQAADGLGLCGVKAQIDKLLLYEQGSFFKRHKDSEKEPGMVGTMVVCLPSQHQGGAVNLSFKSEERSFATGPASDWDMTTLAWYSDVTHEIAKLTDGYRLVLTYKLIQTDGTAGSAKSQYKRLKLLRTLLLGWHSTTNSDTMLYYPLEHQYTQVSLSLANMKGRDAAVCQILHQACLDCGIFLLFGHLNREVFEDEDELQDEVSLKLETVYSPEGTKIASKICVDESGILRTGLFDRSPDSHSGHEYTGNEHSPAVSRYHETVVILIPKHRLDRLIDAYWNPYLEDMVSMVDHDLRAHCDAATASGAVAFFLGVLSENVSAKPAITQTIMHWVMEFESDDLARGLLSFVLRKHPNRDIALRAACRRIERSETIEWNACDVAKSCSVTSWERVLEQFPGYLESEHSKSFKAWARAKSDQILMSQTKIAISDLDFLIQSIKSRHDDSDWIMASLFPVIASRGQRELLYRLLSTLFEGRETKEFTVAKAAFEYMLEHASSRLSIHAAHIGADQENKSPKRCCASFFTLLDQSLTIGVHDYVSKLLIATHDTLKSELALEQDELSNGVVHAFLEPFASVLGRHEWSTCAAAKDIFTLLIGRRVFLQKPPLPPGSLRGWAHKPKTCGTAGCRPCATLHQFVTSRNMKIVRIAFTDESLRTHWESVLPAHLYSINSEQAETGYKIVIEKLCKEVEDARVRYRVAVEELQAQLAPLQGEFTKKLLGDDCYRELILIESQSTDGSSAVGKRPAVKVTGNKTKKGNPGKVG
ncbi:hypothetical protein CONLIGDRAFT_699866 [Coniochaeta ligniaria NRRL 30616]|uniref:Prolyl 4-hydroxylase alpha subunit Fe(2+) 2OG dioxygenase domain-containing protein n=1 Tax=Coniochaeta ligniaria NRRL 30616 TaxID=1408157 RepID=A0A1J7JRN6_9PEZI|nr:hypothetical protein CONLIGDRAFT_699866 [Coniochaeta ligniaria NRRL 30616]